MSRLYTPAYFHSEVFAQNYATLASAIADTYRPRTVIDVGCGPGNLSRALAGRGIAVFAVDGHAQPDFTGHNVTFRPCDLNSAAARRETARELAGPFDVAVCLEVAEHLDPATSDDLIAFLCELAPVVVFSAAVPGQGGHGHINCQPRQAWHDRFTARRYCLAHRIRPLLQESPTVAPWYRHNLVDYVRAPGAVPDSGVLTRSLLQCESALAGDYYAQGDEITRLRAQLHYLPIRAYLALRARAKRLLGR